MFGVQVVYMRIKMQKVFKHITCVCVCVCIDH